MMNEVTKIKQKEDSPENWETLRDQLHTGTLIEEGRPEVVLDSLPDLMEKFEEEKVMEELNKNLNERFEPRNRAERRALEKELKKKNKKKRVFADSIRQAAERLAYTEMIQRVRKMNEELEKEGAKENEAAN